MKRILLSLLVLGMFLLPNNASSDVCYIDEYSYCVDVNSSEEAAACRDECKFVATNLCKKYCGTKPDYWGDIIYDPYCPSEESCYCEYECPEPPLLT